jgi:hypothetical protein
MSNEPKLTVYLDRSVLLDESGKEFTFEEGKQTDEAKKRLKIVKDELTNHYLDKLIEECRNPHVDLTALHEEQIAIIDSLVNSITSEVGRAIVGLCFLQLTIKSILPEQSIRLHKASPMAEFSWKEGMPMRVLDKNFITPFLRKHSLLRLNADGFMMTRSLAENYPYSKLYKAAIRGAKGEWLIITDQIERKEMDANVALKQLIVSLVRKSEYFNEMVAQCLDSALKYIAKAPKFAESFELIFEFIVRSSYSARIFEVCIHSLFQVFEEEKCLGGFLKPLSQMRSANKKHGNIGDIEITTTEGSLDILESWDAKYGKTYLRDELEELNDKLKDHPQALYAGFITDASPNLSEEITERMSELEELHNVHIEIVDFKSWVDSQINRFNLDLDKVGVKWIVAIVESICLKRTEKAPIDEPTIVWIGALIEVLKKRLV